MNIFRVTIGEIEHSGDVDLTLRQLRDAGFPVARCVRTNVDDENALFEIETDRTAGEMFQALTDAEVCI